MQASAVAAEGAVAADDALAGDDDGQGVRRHHAGAGGARAARGLERARISWAVGERDPLDHFP